MKAILEQVLRQQNIFPLEREGILMANVLEVSQGFSLAKEVLLATSYVSTALYLSGGKTPKEFYHQLSEEENLKVGTVGLVDERFGPRFHENSNEKMIMDSGFLQSLDKKGVKFQPILTGSNDIKETAFSYDQMLRSLHATYQQSIGILGVGVDGHTAGIPADSNGLWKEFDLTQKNSTEMATYFDDHGKFYGPRITMTFLGLSMLDLLLVMVFGEEKREALEKLFSEGPEDEVPSRFYKRPEVASKTLFITDQKL